MKKTLIIFFWALLSLNALGQVVIKNDSLFVNGIPSGEYGLSLVTNSETILQVRIFNPEFTIGTFLNSATKLEFEQLVKDELSNMPFIKSGKFYFQYSFEPEALTEIGKAGELLEIAGSNFNAAILIGFIGSAGGIALSVAGFPVLSAVVIIGGGVIALGVQISGNNKLKQAGRKLKQHR
jgi:hypothetical protein